MVQFLLNTSVYCDNGQTRAGHPLHLGSPGIWLDISWVTSCTCSAHAGAWTERSPEVPGVGWRRKERPESVDGIRCVQGVNFVSLGCFIPTQRDCVNPECRTSLVWQNWCISISKVQNTNLI